MWCFFVFILLWIVLGFICLPFFSCFCVLFVWGFFVCLFLSLLVFSWLGVFLLVFVFLFFCLMCMFFLLSLLLCCFAVFFVWATTIVCSSQTLLFEVTLWLFDILKWTTITYYNPYTCHLPRLYAYSMNLCALETSSCRAVYFSLTKPAELWLLDPFILWLQSDWFWLLMVVQGGLLSACQLKHDFNHDIRQHGGRLAILQQSVFVQSRGHPQWAQPQLTQRASSLADHTGSGLAL